jgi:hypothetical protein
MALNQQEISHKDRFRPESFPVEEKSIIAGALNRYGVENPFRADENNLTAFTWDQVLQSLILSRRDSIGDAQEDVEDVIYAVRDERRNLSAH